LSRAGACFEAAPGSRDNAITRGHVHVVRSSVPVLTWHSPGLEIGLQLRRSGLAELSRVYGPEPFKGLSFGPPSRITFMRPWTHVRLKGFRATLRTVRRSNASRNSSSRRWHSNSVTAPTQLPRACLRNLGGCTYQAEPMPGPWLVTMRCGPDRAAAPERSARRAGRWSTGRWLRRSVGDPGPSRRGEICEGVPFLADVWWRFDLWAKDGTWNGVLGELQAPSTPSRSSSGWSPADSTVAMAQLDDAGARKNPKGGGVESRDSAA